MKELVLVRSREEIKLVLVLVLVLNHCEHLDVDCTLALKFKHGRALTVIACDFMRGTEEKQQESIDFAWTSPTQAIETSIVRLRSWPILLRPVHPDASHVHQ